MLQSNVVDGGHRRCITVQYPEPYGASESTSTGVPIYRTIADVCRDRIKRAGAKMLEEAGLMENNLDVGFRTLKIDSTNLTDVRLTPDALVQEQLDLYADSVKADRTGEDLLFQVLLDWGLDLTMPIAVEQIDGHEVFVVDDGALIACFDAEVGPSLVREIANRKPLRAVFRDSGFATDADRINAEQVFAEASPATDVKAI